MNCRSAEPLLSAFLEDDLSQNERRNLESHLLSCRRCSQGVRELRATLEMLQTIPEVETSPHFEADLLARIRSGEGLRPSLIEWLRTYLEPARLRPLFLAGAGACAIWISVLLVGPNGVLHATSPELAQSKSGRDDDGAGSGGCFGSHDTARSRRGGRPFRRQVPGFSFRGVPRERAGIRLGRPQLPAGEVGAGHGDLQSRLPLRR